MRRMLLRLFAFASILILPLVAGPAWAQEASPSADEEMAMPGGIALAELAQLAPIELPAEPTALLIERLTLEPGTEIPAHPHHGLEIVLIEAGSVTALTTEGPPVQVVRADAAGTDATPEAAGPGEELTANAGDIGILPVGHVSGFRAGDAGATILVFALVSQADEGTPAA